MKVPAPTLPKEMATAEKPWGNGAFENVSRLTRLMFVLRIVLGELSWLGKALLATLYMGGCTQAHAEVHVCHVHTNNTIQYDAMHPVHTIHTLHTSHTLQITLHYIALHYILACIYVCMYVSMHTRALA